MSYTVVKVTDNGPTRFYVVGPAQARGRAIGTTGDYRLADEVADLLEWGEITTVEAQQYLEAA